MEKIKAGLCTDCGKWTDVIHRGYPMCTECFEKRINRELKARSRFLSGTKSFEHWEEKDVVRLFYILIEEYVSDPDKYWLDRLEWAYEWVRIHNISYAEDLWSAWTEKRLSPTFEKERIRLLQGNGGIPIEPPKEETEDTDVT